MGCPAASLLFMLGTCLLLHTRVVSGACCTSGQPLYTNHDIFISPTYDIPVGLLTCSDGPCSDQSSQPQFDYRPNSYESAIPAQCCDSQNLGQHGSQQSNAASYYNPQQGGGNWLGSAGANYNNGASIPGTGRTCNYNLPVVTCGITGLQSETCQSLKTSSVSCAADTVYVDSNNLKTTSKLGFQSACCKDATCADLMSTSICTDVTEYNADVGTSTATTTSFQSLCCQQKTCSQLANLPNTKCSIDTKRKTSADNTRTSNFQQDCCEDKTCADFSSSKQCDSPSTVYNEERNTEITTDTTFQQECCKVLPTCDNTDPAAAGMPKQYDCASQAPVGTWTYFASPGTLNPNTDNCCRKRTCLEMSTGSEAYAGAQCDTGTKLSMGKAAVLVDDFQQQCCVPNSCADIRGSQTCATGYTPKDSTTEVGVTAEYVKDCCTPVPPTCANTVPTDDTATKYDCSKTATGIWKYDDMKNDQTDPSIDNCCTQSSCGTLRDVYKMTCDDGFKWGGTATKMPTNFNTDCCVPNTCADIPGSCGQGYNAKPLTTMVGPAPLYTRDCCSEIGATCGNTLPKNTPAVKYDCSKISPGIYKFDGNKVDQTGPSDTNCCKVATCSDAKTADSTCNIGTEYNGVGTTDVKNSYQQDCCQPTPPTCNNTVPVTPGVQYDCSTKKPGLWAYDNSKDGYTPPDCCKQLSCEEAKSFDATTYSCPAGYSYTGASVATFSSFTSECCTAIPATCANTAPATPNLKYSGCSTKTPGLWTYDSTKGGNTPPDCCKQLSCDEAKAFDATTYSCPAGYSYTGASVATFSSFTSQCCSAIPATCANTVPTTPGIKYSGCSTKTPGLWAYDTAKGGNTPPDCCKQLSCQDAKTLDATKYSCPAGYSYTGTTTTLFTNFVNNCCTAIPATCANTVPATPNIQYDCSSKTPGVWVYDSSKASSTPPDCCKRLSCAAAKAASPSTYYCPSGYNYIGTDTILFTDFTKDCCQAQAASPTCRSLKDKGSTCAAYTAYDTTKDTTVSSSTTFKTDCCKAVTCAEAKTAGSACPSGTTYMTSNDAIKISGTFGASCCTTTCKFSGSTCPTLTWTDVASSFIVTAGSSSNKVNILFTNGFVYSKSCTTPTSWITVATCSTCQRLSQPSIGTAFNQLKDVECGSTIYVVGHDGSYKSYTDDKNPQEIYLSTCQGNPNLKSISAGACVSGDQAGACVWPLTVPACGTSSQSSTTVTLQASARTKTARRSRFSM